MSDAHPRLRLDKWLWAARFFKTRALAKQAIEGGKVHCNGQRAKPAKEISVGDELRISRGPVEETVAVLALSDRRGGAPQARLLYEEHPESITAREDWRAQRRLQGGPVAPQKRPDKQQRRVLRDLKQGGGT